MIHLALQNRAMEGRPLTAAPQTGLRRGAAYCSICA